MTLAIQTDHWAIDVDEAARLVCMVRSAVPFARVDTIDEAMKPVYTTIDPLRHRGFVALVDLRDGPLRSDDAFEMAFEKHRVALSTGWTRVAVLVRSAVGKLQVQRHQAKSRAPVQIFHDEAEARSYLASDAR
jgi:hypothetical protein